jgi:hypothetical protein
VAPSKARFVHLIVDACKSYFLVNARGAWRNDQADDAHDAELSKFLADEEGVATGRYPRVGVIVATSGDQETHEWSRYRGGILSHELRSALYGAADVNGDGRVEYSELRAFIAAANARVKNPEARLDVYARAPAADRHRPLVDLRRSASAKFLHFAPPERGQYYLEDDRGLRLMDMNKEASAQFDLAIDPARTYYLRHDELEEAELKPAQIKPRKIRIGELRFHPRALAARGALEQSFRRDLYQVPFGRGFYDGFVATSGDLPVDGDPAPFLVEELKPTLKRHSLQAGYLVSGAPLDMPGALHGVDARYQYRVARFLDLGLAAQFGVGSADTAAGHQQLTRVAVMAVAAGEWRPVAALGLRLDVAAGWQYASGQVDSHGSDGIVAGSDPAGARFEVAGGLVFDLTPTVGLSARGGLAIDVATLKPYRDTEANLSPLLNVSLLIRL